MTTSDTMSANARPSFLTVVGTLTAREWKLFLTARGRLIGTLGQAVIFWVLLGAGLQQSFRHPFAGDQMKYSEYFFPGALLLILLFAAIFSTITIIEDRRSGFLQSILVAPISPFTLVCGHAVGGATIALAQAVVLLLPATWLGIPFNLIGWLAAIGVMALLALAMTALGIGLGWKMESVSGYHSVMNVLLMPMWLLSGALFPVAGAAGWMQTVMAVNPLRYGDAALRAMLYWNHLTVTAPGPSTAFSIGAVIVFALICIAGAVFAVRRALAG